MKTTEQNIIKFVDRNALIANGDKLLFALSGGSDSVFALSFFVKYQNRFNITLAACHINHCLRGAEADLDEQFCLDFCKKLDIPFFSEKVNIKKYAKDNKLSIEEAAREIRYKILSDVANKNRYSKIVVAHNQNDNSETVLLNLIKGTGLSGISGIPIKRGSIIRPILITSKDEILEYLAQNKIDYKTDRTNFENDYQRNFLRNEIIPKLKAELNPSLDSALFRSSNNFKNSKTLLEQLIEEKAEFYLKFSDEKLELNLEFLEQYGKPLFDAIIRYGLSKYFSFEANYEDSLKLFDLVGNQTGRKIILSDNLIVYKERNSLLIKKTAKGNIPESVIVKAGEEGSFESKKVKIEIETNGAISTDLSNKNEIISGDNIDDIFILRRWKSGDKFIPLGMKGFKNVSDFLNEQKIPANEKEQQLVLLNKNDIVWVVGYRIDERFKINKKSKKVFRLCLKN